ncbi:MAG: peptidylprolyl isomerase [Acidobacteria bacterium]|nr:peptidylprolyl isomerase [Acidobacteriota bacterium]
MLNIFRRKDMVTRFVVGSILVFIALAMVITLIPGIMSTSTTDAVPNTTVAEVGGEEITSWELQRRLFQLGRQRNIPQEMMPLFIPSILDQMILEKITIQEAGRLGLVVSREELQKRLQQDPNLNLFPEGKFVGQQQYENMIASNGVTVAQFEQSYRDGMLYEKLLQVVTDSLTVTPEEVSATFHNENEKVVLDYVFLNPASFQDEVGTSEAELKAYFEENRESYPVPEKRSVQILYVENQKLREGTTVSEEEIQEYYENDKDNYRIEERVQVSHILLLTPDKTPEKVEEVKKKASDLLEQLEGGADFAALAKENSEDPVSAANGGDLGWIVRQQTVPEFETAAFTLEPGTLSDLIETVYGFHILKVMAHEQPFLRTLEQVKGEIQIALLEEKVNSGIFRMAEQAAAALRRAPDDIESLAEQYGAVLVAPPPFTRGDVIPRIGSSPSFMGEVFALEKGEVALPIPGPDGYAVPLLLDVFPGHPGEYEEVQEQVRTNYVSAKSREMAQTKVDQLTERLDQLGKKDLKQAARALNLAVETTEPVTRQGAIPSVGNMNALGPKPFKAELGEVVGPVLAGGGNIFYQVASREPAEEQDMEQQATAIQQRLLAQKRQLTFETYQDNLKDSMAAAGDLWINEDAIAQLTTVAP